MTSIISLSTPAGSLQNWQIPSLFRICVLELNENVELILKNWAERILIECGQEALAVEFVHL
jgi:hypothetical protein